MKHPERVEDYLEHIVEAIQRATGYAADLDSPEALHADKQAQDAIVRNITIIGEAVGRIQKASLAFIAGHPELPWHEMRGMRNRIVHDYFDLDWRTFRDAVKADLPALQEWIECAIAELCGYGLGNA